MLGDSAEGKEKVKEVGSEVNSQIIFEKGESFFELFIPEELENRIKKNEIRWQKKEEIDVVVQVDMP